MLNDKYETHPSYGLISIARTSSGADKSLFGSSIKHHNTIRLRISKAEYCRESGYDHYMNNESLIEVEMSNSQFAELITTANIGVGVPCTLTYIGSERVEPCPYRSKRKQFEGEFKEDIKDINKTSNELIEEVAKLFEDKRSFTKADKEAVLNKLYKLSKELNSSTNYLYSMFNEQMDNTVKEAKGEIEAFLLNKLTSLNTNGALDNTEPPVMIEG